MQQEDKTYEYRTQLLDVKP